MGDHLDLPAQLLGRAEELAETDPRQALSILDGLHPDPSVLAGRMDWARGRALRLLGHNHEACSHLESAVALLEAAGEADLAAQASVTLAAERINEARFDEAISLLDTAAARLVGPPGALALAQKALALQRADRSDDALAVWDEAIDRFVAASMIAETGAAQQNRGLVRFYRGDLVGAELDLTTAERTFRAAGLDIRAIDARHNLGLVHAGRGDLPRAFEAFDAAQAEAARRGSVRPQTLVDRAQVALDAGLISEGRTLAELAVERLQAGGFLTDVPEACLLAARAAELDGDAGRAAEWASQAAVLFAGQGRARWELLARVAVARAQAAVGTDTALELHALAGSLRAAGWDAPATEADTAAAVLDVGRARLTEAGLILAGLRGHTSGAARLELRVAQAGYRTATGDVRGARHALIASVGALRRHRATLGSVELRSRAGSRSDAVISAGVGFALATDDPVAALWTAEAVRYPIPVAPQDDPEVAALLGDLRAVNARLEGLEPSPDLTRLRRRRAAVEELLRRRARHRRPSGPMPAPQVDTTLLIAASVERPIIEYCGHGDRLHALVVADGGVDLVPVAALADARRAVAGLRLSLHIAVTDGGDVTSLAQAAASAQEILLDPIGLDRPDRLMIVSDRTLASCPWALLPALEATEMTTAPSGMWWHDRSSPAGPAGGRVVLVAGPGLKHTDAEVSDLASIWPGATVIAGADATVARVTSAMADADIVHVAAHASHRGDHPLLSGIRLSDGHLTGYELSTLRLRAQLMVLSCCETGMAETAGGIGLSRLVTEQCGAATAVASVSPLADSRAGPLMADFHRRVAGGAVPARALVESRNASGGPLGNPSAAGLLCYGV